MNFLSSTSLAKSKGLFLFLIINSWVFGQFEIQVVSEETNMPIKNAQVKVVSPTGTEQQRKTNEHGLFPIELEKGTKFQDYQIHISADGFEPFNFVYDGSVGAVCPLTPTHSMIDNVVITGQISMTTADKSVHKIRVLDRKTIDAKGAVNLRDVLTNELNIRVTQDQMLGSGMQLQGLGGENVKILIDGVSVIGRLNGDIDLSQINLNDIERIEIVEGPLSVNYGSNALAGTINLITKKQTRNGFQGSLNTYYETVGQYNVDGKLAYNAGKHRVSVSGMRNFFDGWKKADPFIEFPKSKLADTNRVTQWRPKEQYSADVRYSYVGKKFSINPFADFYFETMTNRGMPRKPTYVTAFDDIFQTRRFNQGIDFKVFPNAKYKIQGVVAHNYYSRFKNTYIKDLTTLQSQLTATPSDQDTSVFRTIMSRSSFVSSSTTQKIDYEVGYDVNFDMAQGKRISDTSKTMGDYAVFGSMEWKAFQNFIVRPAARVAYNSVFNFNLVPSLNLKYGYKNWSFRTSYAKGYRAPSMKELYMDFVDINHDIHGNSNLKPEQSHNVQAWINYRLDLKNIKYNDKIDFELNGYYQSIDDKITLSQNGAGTIYSYFNIDRFEATGGKFVVTYKNDWITAKIGASLIALRTNYSGKNFTVSPEINSSVMYSWRKARMNFSVFYKYTGRAVTFMETETGMVQSVISDYNILDVNVSKAFWKNHLVVAVGGKNLLGVTNVTASLASAGGAHSGGGGLSPIAWGTSVYVRLSLNFDTFSNYSKKK
ncbi:MAG TPA: TonB-dependent receptor [Crocinitomicaceae bacterium]|nr:TonB-dependent receptor [Crocinitomicaceae bacterium]